MATTTLHPAARTYRSTLYEWVTTTDHKKIGVMYLINSFIFFFIGGLLALGVRSELAQPGLQFVTDQVYNELFTMHATFMLAARLPSILPPLSPEEMLEVSMRIASSGAHSRGSSTGPA